MDNSSYMLKSSASVMRPDMAGLKDQGTDASFTLFLLARTDTVGRGRQRNSYVATKSSTC